MFKYFFKYQGQQSVNFTFNKFLQSQKLIKINLASYSKLEQTRILDEEEDEVAELNKRILDNAQSHSSKKQSTQNSQPASSLSKSSFKLDILKDVKNYYDSKKPKVVENEDIQAEAVIKKKLKKLSQAEQVTIRKDEDVSKFNIKLHNERDTDSILDSVFKHGTNKKFYDKLDLIYDKVTNEEIDNWEKIGKSTNLYEENLDNDKDLSDLEEELNKIDSESYYMNLLGSKEDKQEKKVKTIEEYLGIEHIKLSTLSSEKKTNSAQNKSKKSTPELEEQKKTYQYVKPAEKLNINFGRQNEIEIKTTNNNQNNFSQQQNQQIQNYQFLNPTQGSNTLNLNNTQPEISKTNKLQTVLSSAQLKSTYKQIMTPLEQQLNLSIFNPASLNPDLSKIPSIPNIYPLKKTEQDKSQHLSPSKIENISKNKNQLATLKDDKKIQSKSPLSQSPIRTKLTVDFFRRLKMGNYKESFIQQTFLNQKYDNQAQLFDYFWDNILEEKEYLNKKTQEKYFKRQRRNNAPQHLLENYKIKTFGDKFSIKLFKATLFEFDRSRLEMITSRIVNSKESVITIVFNSKRGLTDRTGQGVFVIFAGENQVGTILVNIGVVQNILVMNYFTSFMGLVLAELIQMTCQNTGSKNLLHFNLVMAKKFDVEAKLHTESKNRTVQILNYLIDAKLGKFKQNQGINFDEIFDDEGKIKKSSSASNVTNFKLPNLKFHNYSTVLKKYFTQYFNATANLETGNLCYKI
jgi:hypothetical protein